MTVLSEPRTSRPGAGARTAMAVMAVVALAASLSAQTPPPPTSTTAPEQLSEAQKAELQMLTKWLRDDSMSPDKRRDTATLLVNKGWPAAEAVLVETLSNKESLAGRQAVAEALAAEFSRTAKPPKVYVDPLINVLGDANDTLRRTAARALSAYGDQPDVVERLRALATDPAKPIDQRRGAVAAFSQMPPISANIVEALVVMLEDKDAELRSRVIEALNAMTGVEMNSVAARKEWWAQNRTRPPIEWVAKLNARLRQQNHQLRQQREQLEKRLLAAVKAIYEATPAPQQGEALLKYFGDAQPVVRALALELVDQKIIGQNLAVPDPVKKAVMERLTDESPAVRAAAADVIPYIAEPKAAGQLLAQLKAEADVPARTRMIKALGLLRATEAIGDLVK
ncbi:MAG: HEAT repeat domain-containing protein, partial [Phycisphaerae bacterium]|nr:HEAT repeat domain-containing protein [Phycisphaerae bacterium]